MTVSEAVRRAVPVFVSNPDADVYDVRAALVRAGIPIELAADIVEFLPVAVARAMMEGMGVRFADEYVRQTADGRVLGRKKLTDEPVYQEGWAVAGEMSGMGDETFLALVRRSAEYRAVSKALDAGTDPADLECAPLTMTANENDRRYLHDTPLGPSKPWWQFWK